MRPAGADAGIYLAEGTTLTLSATARPGLLFAGWGGDTAAGDTLLTLTMGRPYTP